LAKDAEEAAKEAAIAAAEQAALDLAAKAFCRIAVPALLAPLELLEDLIPIFGEIADIAEIAATPELINVCVKGIEKEGKAEFKIFGKEHSLEVSNNLTFLNQSAMGRSIYRRSKWPKSFTIVIFDREGDNLLAILQNI
jgi:hypothetical protein